MPECGKELSNETILLSQKVLRREQNPLLIFLSTNQSAMNKTEERVFRVFKGILVTNQALNDFLVN